MLGKENIALSKFSNYARDLLYIELFIASLFGILSFYFYLKQKKISNSQEDITIKKI